MTAWTSEAGEGGGDLISDIGRSSIFHSPGETPEQQLMRLANCPLAVGAFIGRSQRDHQGLASATKVSQVIALAEDRDNDGAGRLDVIRRQAGWERYVNNVGDEHRSTVPLSFTPSPEDQAKALEILPDGIGQAEQRAVGNGSGLRSVSLLICTLMVLLTVLAAMT